MQQGFLGPHRFVPPEPTWQRRFIMEAGLFVASVKEIRGVRDVFSGPIYTDQRRPVEPVEIEHYYRNQPTAVRVRYFTGKISQLIKIDCPVRVFPQVVEAIDSYCAEFIRTRGFRVRE